METQKSISLDMTLIGKAILIEFKPLIDNEQETLEYTKTFYENLKTTVYQAQNQNQDIIITSEQN